MHVMFLLNYPHHPRLNIMQYYNKCIPRLNFRSDVGTVRIS